MVMTLVWVNAVRLISQACVLVEVLAPILDPDDKLELSTLRPRKPMTQS